MSSQYTDANVSLKDLALTQFELARDIPAAIELMSPNPQTLDIQVRMLLLKINAALSNFKLSRLTVGIGIKDLSFFSPILHFLHGDKDTRLKIFSYDPSAWTKKSPVVNEVLEKLNRDQFLNSETEITHSVIKDDGFGILLLPSAAVNEAREFIDALSTRKNGLLLIHNYSKINSPSHHLYAAERDLRLIEIPDGSGECYCLR